MPAERVSYADKTNAKTPTGLTNEFNAANANQVKAAANDHADLLDGINARVNSVIHHEASPAAEWVIAHNFGRPPYVVVIAVGGERVEPDIDDFDNPTFNIVRLKFSPATAGKAYLF